MAKMKASRALVAFLVATPFFLGAGPASAEGFWSGVKDFFGGSSEETVPPNGPAGAAAAAQKVASASKPIAAPVAVAQIVQPPVALAVLPKAVSVECVPAVVKPVCDPPKKVAKKKVAKKPVPVVAKVPSKVVETIAKPAMVPDAECTALVPTLYRVMIWQKNAKDLPGVKETVAKEATSPPGSEFGPGKFSRTYGKMLREKGVLSIIPHMVYVDLVKASGKVRRVYSGIVTGKHTVTFEPDFEMGDVYKLTVAEDWRFASPQPSGLLLAHSEARHCRTNVHLLEEQ